MLIAATDGRDGAVTAHQDADVCASRFCLESSYIFPLSRPQYLDTGGSRSRDSQWMALEAGDGAAISEENMLAIKPLDHAEILLFDLA